MSKLINNRIDLKSLTFDSFSNAIKVLKANELENVTADPNTSLAILTNFGLIQGTLTSCNNDENITKDNVNTFFVETITKKVFEIRDKTLIKLEEENPDLKLINDSSSIILKDVTITPYSNPNNKIHLGILTLFTDQIIGFSFGTFSD